MSSERESLIAAIRESPDDDTLRLVCADWFEDQGDEANVARAELIRLQIQRANLPIEDDRHSELQARELRLLKRFAPVWRGKHFAGKEVHFRRGFIEYVKLHLHDFLHQRRDMLRLEPVRDVCLTGWLHSPSDLVRRVAKRDEWQYIETLRIPQEHPTAPQQRPRDLVFLLRFAPLSRLKSLHCPPLVFESDTQRYFADLPVLGRLRELRLSGWNDRPVWLRCSELAFWNRLTSLELLLSSETPSALSVLHDRLPPGLQNLKLSCVHSGADYSPDDPFFARLTQLPLRRLSLGFHPLPESTLARLLAEPTRWDLRELSLRYCGLTAAHARMIAAAPRLKNLHSLDLSLNDEFGVEAARALFSSPHLRSVVHLNLSSSRVRNKGVEALASAGWNHLRSLDLTASWVGPEGLRALLDSPNVQRLTSLGLGENGNQGEPHIDVSPELAMRLTQLPHLVRLRLSPQRLDRRIEPILNGSESLAWVLIEPDDDPGYQEAHAPEREPPVEDVQ
jgi:uncharacterized protein (TIGR02996 family)